MVDNIVSGLQGPMSHHVTITVQIKLLHSIQMNSDDHLDAAHVPDLAVTYKAGGQSDTSYVTALPPVLFVWRLSSTMDKREYPRPSSSSFVYPVRSLLHGIQPAGSPLASSESTISSLPSEYQSGWAHYSVERRSFEMDSAMSVTGSLSGPCVDSATDAHNLQSLSSGQLSGTKITSARDTGEPSGIFPSPTQRPLDFSLLSGEESVQQSPTVFSGARTSSSSPSHDFEYSKDATLAMAQANFEKSDLPLSSSTTTNTSIYESPCSMDVDAGTAIDCLVDQDDVPGLPFNPSECGIVHLPPISISTSRQESDEAAFNASNLSVHAVSALGTGNEPTASDACQSGPSMERRRPSTDTTVYSTFRFQHAQDEHGHHVIIGREGEFRRCEDEVNIHPWSDSQIDNFSIANPYTRCYTSVWRSHGNGRDRECLSYSTCFRGVFLARSTGCY